MNSGSYLYLSLLIIYATECFTWLPADAFSFVSLRGRLFRIPRAGGLFANHRGALQPLYPLPFLGSVFVCTKRKLLSPLSEDTLAQVRQRVRLWKKAALPVRLCTSLLMIFLFAICPVVVGLQGLLASWLTLLIELFVIVALTVWRFFIAHRRLYPSMKSERLSKAIVMSLSPLAAMRATDTLSLHLLEGFHPATVALALCDQKSATGLARQWLVDSGIADESGWGRRPAKKLHENAKTAENLLRQAGLSLSAVLAPPPIDEDHCLTYCPRCACQYTVASGSCESCTGIALRPFR